MNILFVYNQVILPWRGGTERVAYNVGKGLEQIGHGVFYLATDACEEDCSKLLPEKYITLSRKLTLVEKQNEILSLCKNKKIDVIINEYGDFDNYSLFNHDVIPPYVKIITCLHLDVYGNMVYFRRKNHVDQANQSFLKRFIVDFFTFFFTDPYKIRLYLRKKTQMRKMLSSSDVVVVPNPVIAGELERLTGCECDNVYSIFNPILEKMERNTLEMWVKSKTILYVGRFALDKNVDHIVRAWSLIADSHRDWKLNLVGDGETFESVSLLIKRKNIPRVTMYGLVEDAIPFYKESQYVVLASDCESWSCVVQEALMHGCFPIVYDYPAASLVIPNPKWGIRVSKHKPQALAAALKYAIENECSNQDNMKDILENMKKYDLSEIVKNWDRLLRKITYRPSDVASNDLL